MISREVLERLSPEDRAAALAAIDVLGRQADRNPLEAVHACAVPCGRPGCRPYAQQAAFLASREFRKCFFGGNGAGKTRVGVLDDVIQLIDRSAVPTHLQAYKRWEPPFFLRVIVPKTSIVESSLLEHFRALTPKEQLAGGSFDKAFNKQRQVLSFANGSSVLFNSADQEVDAHASVKLHRAHFDEEPDGEHGRQVYHENLARLRDYMPEAQVMFTMTPQNGLSWSYDELWGRRDDPDVFCVVASLLDNPWIDGAAMAAEMAKSMSKRELQARVEGKFVHFAGLVLDIDDEKHVVDAPAPKHVQGLETVVGIDPGIARGGVVWVGFDRDNAALVYDELYPSGLTVPQIVAQIREKNAKWGVKPRMYVIDPSARNRSMVDANSVEAVYQREGIVTVPGQNDRRAGIMQLQARLEHKGLLISRECRNLLWETSRYVVDRDEETSEQRPKTKNSDSFATKGPDHLIDPLRYVCLDRIWYQAHNPTVREQWKGPGYALPAGYWQRPVSRDYGPLGNAA